MSILNKIPDWIPRAARKVLPAQLVDDVRDVILRRFYRSISMVEREPRPLVWFRRVMHRKPVLHHFEIHITDHCNLNCKGCAHFSNLCPPTFADIDEFTADMNSMASLFSAVRQIYLLGGEPLLHPRLPEFIYAARAAFPRTHISLMTNGLLVTRMGSEFWESLAKTRTILLCDSYPINLPVEKIDRLGREHGVEVEWTIPREDFFKIPIDPRGGHDVQSSFNRCQGFNNCPIIRHGRIYPCAYTAFADVFRERFDVEGLRVSDADSISIRGDVDGESVIDFLRKPVPWCGNCDMDGREFYTWGRSSRCIEEWTSSV